MRHTDINVINKLPQVESRRESNQVDNLFQQQTTLIAYVLECGPVFRVDGDTVGLQSQEVVGESTQRLAEVAVVLFGQRWHGAVARELWNDEWPHSPRAHLNSHYRADMSRCVLCFDALDERSSEKLKLHVVHETKLNQSISV